MLRQLQAVKMELRKRMHDPIAKTGAWLHQMLKGYLNYYAVSGNSPSLWWYFNEVRWRWLKSLKRRSQRAFMSCHQLHRPLLPVDQDITPVALSPFRRQNPRDEPGALAAHAGIRAGGGRQQPLLPRPCAQSVWPLTIWVPEEQAPLAQSGLASSRRSGRSRSTHSAVKSSILERNSLRIGEVFALL
jgi:hypothetical protein